MDAAADTGYIHTSYIHTTVAHSMDGLEADIYSQGFIYAAASTGYETTFPDSVQ